MLFGEMSVQGNVPRINVLSGNCPLGNCRLGKCPSGTFQMPKSYHHLLEMHGIHATF